MVKKGQRMEENSLVVQWLGFGCGTAGTWVQSLVWELRSHKSQSSPGSPSNKKKNDRKVMMENNFREQWVGGTLRKPDERDSAREETKVSRFPQHYLAKMMWSSSFTPQSLTLACSTFCKCFVAAEITYRMAHVQKYSLGYELLCVVCL